MQHAFWKGHHESVGQTGRDGSRFQVTLLSNVNWRGCRLVYCTIYYTILYYAILYYTVLYYTTIYYKQLFLSSSLCPNRNPLCPLIFCGSSYDCRIAVTVGACPSA